MLGRKGSRSRKRPREIMVESPQRITNYEVRWSELEKLSFVVNRERMEKINCNNWDSEAKNDANNCAGDSGVKRRYNILCF